MAMLGKDIQSQNLVDVVLLEGRVLKKFGERHFDDGVWSERAGVFIIDYDAYDE
jgi:hypothetical protein